MSDETGQSQTPAIAPITVSQLTPITGHPYHRVTWHGSLAPPGSPASLLELERHFQSHPIGFHLAIGDRHILLADLGDAQIAQRLGSPLHCGCGRLLP